MYTIAHHQAIPSSTDGVRLLAARERALIEARHLARGVADLARWLAWRCPQLWAAAGDQLREEWPGEVHPVTACLARYWLALQLAGAMRPDVRLALCAPLRALEAARQAYHAGEPSEAYRVWCAAVCQMRAAPAIDEQDRSIGRIRASRVSWLAGCGIGSKVQRFKSGSRRSRDAGTPSRQAAAGAHQAGIDGHQRTDQDGRAADR